MRLISRTRKDLSAAYPEIVAAVAQLPLRQGVLDGEIVAVAAAGNPSFQALQHAGGPGRNPRPIYYFAFDLLNLEGKSLLSLRLLDRKRLLEQALRKAPAELRFAGFLPGEPDDIAAAIRDQNLEGVVAKLANSRYEPDQRSGSWVKWKCGFEQEFVIGGYTRGQGGRADFGALIVGYYEGGKLRYASKVGTGFSNVQIREIQEAAEPLRQLHSPFDSIPESGGTAWSYGLTAAERKATVWVRPELVCRVRFTEWTAGGHLRHPAFEGLRDDKGPRDVTRERTLT